MDSDPGQQSRQPDRPLFSQMPSTLRGVWDRLPSAARPLLLLGPIIALVLVRGWLNDRPEVNRKPPPLVSTAPVQKGTMAVRYPLTGEVRALVSAEVRPEVTGVIRRVFFQEGTMVRRGDPLFQINPAPYQAAYDQARASTIRAEARLEEARAQARLSAVQLRLARDRAQRYSRLGTQGAISLDDEENFRTQADVARAGLSAARSGISSAEADVQAALAAQASARLNLQRTLVRAPISGRIGQLRITVGNLVRDQEDKPLVVVNEPSPLDVVFGIPQQWQGRIVVGQPVTIEHVPPLRGRILSLDNTTNASTGTLTAKARLDPPTAGLTPGMNVNGTVTVEKLDDALLIPSQALQRGQKGAFVYVVRQGRAALVPVRSLASDGGRTAVAGSLQAGEAVVVAGQFYLAPGAAVRQAGAPEAAATGSRPDRPR
jgi:RND family efflux transporter MFP subunit